MPLNPQQLEVVNHVDGPCLVTAVPGSGKTTALTERTKRMVQNGVDPASILAVTFTNKAADEMRERIGRAVGPRASKITICTFHSLCARILRQHSALVGLANNYTIYDAAESEHLIKSCVSRVNGDEYEPTDEYLRGITSYLEGRRNACLTHQQAAERYRVEGTQLKVIQTYFTELRKSNAIDFTGLISEANRLFDEHPEIRDMYRGKWRYISVDEVQDTNIAQYRLISHLALGHRNIVVVGDYDQSCYRWRHASPENILSFERDFGAKVLKLEVNYRSVPEILGPSQSLIEKNRTRKATVLRTDNPSGEKPKIVFSRTEDMMGDSIVGEVQRRLDDGVPPKEIAILYRTNYLSRMLENKLRFAKVDYRIIGGLSFWDRKEVKWAVSILKLLANSSDRIAFEKSVEACCRGLGDKHLHEITDNAAAKGIDLIASAKMFADGDTAVAKGVMMLLDGMRPGDAPALTLRKLLHGSAFASRIQKDSTTENDRVANVEEVAADVERCMGAGRTLDEYLQGISLAGEEKDEEGDEDRKIVLMTMHRSKGLEFEVVLISHAIEGVVPHSRTLALEGVNDGEYVAQLEEERRLMYVAMTRAKKTLRLYLCGQRGNSKVQASRFLFETGIQTYRS